ncbi:MAG TPA: Glu/Leu/Phe/Val dehydrogenase dimerization domain-containing protein, partial [Actinomycetota bacterium]
MFEEFLEGWEGEQVLVRHDPHSGTWMFVCMHSTRLGPAAGGTRMRMYSSPAEGLVDGLRLAEGMTPKFAIAGLPFGGGKGVLAVRALPSVEERRRIVSRYAQMVASLRGSFHTGPDMNTSELDMDIIAERGGFAFGRSPAQGGSGSSAADTAVGVFHGIRA